MLLTSEIRKDAVKIAISDIEKEIKRRHERGDQRCYVWFDFFPGNHDEFIQKYGKENLNKYKYYNVKKEIIEHFSKKGYTFERQSYEVGGIPQQHWVICWGRKIKTEKLGNKNKIRLGKALVNAYFKGDKVLISVEKEYLEFKCISMEDVLSVFDLEDNSPEDFNNKDYMDIAMYIKEDIAPVTGDDSCMIHIRIQENDGYQDYLTLWYFDDKEDRVYVENLDEYSSSDDTKEEEELLELIKAFNEKMEEAQDARAEVINYLEETYGIDTDKEYDTIEDNLTWVYGIDVDRVKKLISKEEG